MLQAQQYVNQKTWKPFVGHVVTQSESMALQQHLRADANSLFVSAAISFLDALRGFQNEFYSWSTAKLYYSAFYSIRSLLASNSVAVVYEATKPRRFKAIPGSICASIAGTTHKAVASAFSTEMRGHWLLSQSINLEPPLAWLTALREQANYTRAHFWEPNCPPHFLLPRKNGLRKVIQAYINDELLTFDESHAAIAFPLKALIVAAQSASAIASEDAKFLKARAIDQSGPLTDLVRAMRIDGKGSLTQV